MGSVSKMEYNNQMLKTTPPHKKYARISSEKRAKLINRVLEEGISVVKASKKLGIKISTAKLILKKFKDTGAIFQKKMPNYKRKDSKDSTLISQDLPSQEEIKSAFQLIPAQKIQEKEQGASEGLEEGQSAVGIYWWWPIYYYQM